MANEKARGHPARRGDEHDPHFEEHGHTAEDFGGVGHGEEGFRAEDYPGHNPLRGESGRERERRQEYAWTWPRLSPEARPPRRGSERDRRICDEIGRRIERAEPDLTRVVVRVLDGRVALEGEVASLDDEHVVEGLARSVQGVRDVEGSLVVRADVPRALGC